MRIAIAGYGKMGKMIHSLCTEEIEVTAVVDPTDKSPCVTAPALSGEIIKGCDAVIDFSSPSSVMDNIALYASSSATAVIGTTGWSDRLDEVRELVEKSGARILHSANFSIGVAVFLSLAEEAGRIMNSLPSYDVAITEIHHNAKADSPSGTALMAAQRILATMDRKKEILAGNSEGKIRADQLQVSSLRVGSVPGTHSVFFDSSSDSISITHQARDRRGFASGALQAAAWLVKQPAGLYSMEDFTSSLMTGGKCNA